MTCACTRLVTSIGSCTIAASSSFAHCTCLHHMQAACTASKNLINSVLAVPCNRGHTRTMYLPAVTASATCTKLARPEIGPRRQWSLQWNFEVSNQEEPSSLASPARGLVRNFLRPKLDGLEPASTCCFTSVDTSENVLLAGLKSGLRNYWTPAILRREIENEMTGWLWAACRILDSLETFLLNLIAMLQWCHIPDKDIARDDDWHPLHEVQWKAMWQIGAASMLVMLCRSELALPAALSRRLPRESDGQLDWQHAPTIRAGNGEYVRRSDRAFVILTRAAEESNPCIDRSQICCRP